MVAVRQLGCSLDGALKPWKASEPARAKRRPIQNRITSPVKLPNQQTTIRVPKLGAPECAA